MSSSNQSYSRDHPEISMRFWEIPSSTLGKVASCSASLPDAKFSMSPPTLLVVNAIIQIVAPEGLSWGADCLLENIPTQKSGVLMKDSGYI